MRSHPYQITSLQHPLVKHLVKLRSDSSYRHEKGTFIVEGIKPILELKPEWIKKLIYVENHSYSISADEKWIVSEAIMKKISGMQSPEGLLAEVKIPSFSSLKGLKLILALDGVSDPGNMGTLMRTALALGWNGLYLLPNCCDPYNEKVVRSARGAHFRLPMAKGSAQQLKQLVIDNHLQAFVADIKGQTPDQLPNQVGGCVLVLGNEAHGASADLLHFCSPLTIPMPGEMESLNVAIAGGILMYILKNSLI